MASRLFLWVIVYQVKEVERSRRVRELLRFNGNQIRSCVYEMLASESKIKSLLAELALDLRQEDKVRVYRVCETCRQGTYLFGDVELATTSEAIII